jgi:hypothetical protein
MRSINVHAVTIMINLHPRILIRPWRVVILSVLLFRRLFVALFHVAVNITLQGLIVVRVTPYVDVVPATAIHHTV